MKTAIKYGWWLPLAICVLIVAILLCNTLTAQEPRDNRATARYYRHLPLQSVAQSRANKMRDTKANWHLPYDVPGYYEGIGIVPWRATKRSVVTCLPSGGIGAHDDNSLPLAGDAVAYGFARGKYRTYRVRLWQYPQRRIR